MTKRALRRRRTIDAILASAAAAFREHGYHGTSMEEIADRLLMTKGSLYYYFRDKEGILFAVHDEALDRLLAELARVRRRGGCPCSRLGQLVSAHIRIMVEGFHGTALALEFAALGPGRLRRVVAKRDRYERAIRGLLSEGGRKGCFRRMDPKLAAMALLGSVNWIARWYRPGGEVGAEELSARFLDVFLGGLQSRGSTRAVSHYQVAARAAGGARATRPDTAAGRRA